MRSDNHLHVCMVTNLYPPELIGGAEKHVKQISEELVLRGHSVDVITTKHSDSGRFFTFSEETIGGVNIHRFAPLALYSPIEHQDQPFWKKPIQQMIGLWNPQTKSMIESKLAELSPDIVHIHNFGAFSASTFAAANSIDAKVIHTMHDYGLLHILPNLFKRGSISEPGLLMQPYQYLHKYVTERHLDFVTSPSNFVIKKHQKYGFFQNIPSEVLRLGIELPKKPVEEKLPPLECEEFRLLYVGQITHSKGIDVLIDAVRLVNDINIKVEIIGKGPKKSHLEKRSADLGQITFHGFVSEEQLQKSYENAHAVVVPSRWYDNSPMVIYESYARGTPVIGAHIGGIPELIKEDVTGFLFEPENPRSLATTISKAYHHLDQKSYEWTKEKGESLSLKNHMESLMEMYSRIEQLHGNNRS
jgi:glycosyltransferase involved in cell wall biosynthesis